MTQTVRRIPGQRSNLRRPSSVYAHTTRCVDGHGMPAGGVEDGYVGRSRDVARRTMQHAGLLPQRTGEVCEQPWWDLRVGEVRVLERGDWTDDELAARERYWIGRLQPRYNDRDSNRPDRIRKLEARRHRDARDAARGLPPREWEPVRVPLAGPDPWREVLGSPWTWWAAAWLATSVAVLLALTWVADKAGQDWTLRGRFWTALAAATAAVGWVWWRWRTWWRRLKRSWR